MELADGIIYLMALSPFPQISRIRTAPALRFALGQLSSLLPLISILPSPWSGPLVMSAGANYAILPHAIDALFKPGGLVRFLGFTTQTVLIILIPCFVLPQLHQEQQPLEDRDRLPRTGSLEGVSEEGEVNDAETTGSFSNSGQPLPSQGSQGAGMLPTSPQIVLNEELFWRLTSLVPTLSAVVQSGWVDDNAASKNEVWIQLLQICRRWSLSVWNVLRALDETMRFERASMVSVASR